MPAHTKELPKRRCLDCDKPAKVEVFNTYNSSLGYYCTRHGRALVERINRTHEDLDRRTKR